MITVRNLEFSYKKGDKTIDDLTFHVPHGSIYGFLGANGSGKTTTIRLMLGLCRAESGEIMIGGEQINRQSVEAFRKIGALIENPSIYGHLTGKENLQLHTLYYGLDRRQIMNALSMVGLRYVAEKKAGRYSLGMKQRLGLALCLLHNPSLLILDEPLNGLDPQGIAEIRALLLQMQREEGKTIFISSHLLSEIENTCDAICIIDKGKMLFSGKIEALRDSVIRKRVYKITSDRPEEAMQLIQPLVTSKITKDGNGCLIYIEDKEIIPDIISRLTEKNIRIYEVTGIENNLEELYLKLTNRL